MAGVELPGQDGERLLPVVVVGVDHAERPVKLRARGQHCMAGAPRLGPSAGVLQDVPHLDPAAAAGDHMGLDRVDAGLGHHEQHVVEPGPYRVVDRVIEEGLARRPDRGYLLHPSEARAPPGRHHHQCHRHGLGPTHEGADYSRPAATEASQARQNARDRTPGQTTRRMRMRIGETAPDFEADTTEGKLKFHDWIGDSWAVLFSHPKDFTPVCTTELGYMAKLKPEFDRRNTKIIGLSVDKTENHARWADDIEETQGTRPNYPMIGDTDLAISKAYDMLPESASGDTADRTPADNQTVRNVFIIGPDKKIKLILAYPMSTGRNFDEVLRVLDSLQLTAGHKVSTPVNWKQGEDVIIGGGVSNDEARELFGEWKEPKPYIRIVPQPS